MKNTKDNVKGITLISLVITIIILLILAGIAIIQLTQNGLFENSKLAKERTEYTSAKEIIELKLMEIQIECIYDEEKEYTIAEIARSMKEDKAITIEHYYIAESASTKVQEPEDLTKLKGIVVSVDQYSKYKFLIGEDCKIKGVTTGKIPDIIEDYKKVEDFEKELLGKGTNKDDNNKEDEKEKEETKDIPTVGENVDTSKPIEITTYMAIKSNSKNTLNLAEVENVDYTIKEKTDNINLLENILTANNKADSNDSCEIQVIGTYRGQSYKNNLIVYVEPKNTTTIGEDNYYRIYTVQDLKRFRELINHNVGSTENAIMMNDINLSEVDWEPIGNNIAFKGIFDGQGNSITNIRINTINNETIKNGVGFIGNLTLGTIKNVSFNESQVYSNKNNTGTIVGIMYGGTIENVQVLNGYVESSTNNTGGICGVNGYGLIKECSYNGTVKGGTTTGGIVGNMLSNNTNEGSVSVVSFCSNRGSVTSEYNSGGICGYLGSNAIMKYCYNTASILGTFAGGLVGTAGANDYIFGYNSSYIYTKNIYNSYNKGSVVAEIDFARWTTGTIFTSLYV